MSGWLDALLGLLLPSRCVGCRMRGTVLCDLCRRDVPWLGLEICPGCASTSRQARICRICDARAWALDGIRAACRFEGIARTAVHDLKYRRLRDRARLLGELAAEAIERRSLALDLLVPVPLAAARQRQRGFNQSELIARRLSEQIGVPMDVTALRRIRETPPQVGRSAADRRLNVSGAFECVEPGAVAGRRVALVDDVMTTGATLDACAEVLKRHGAARVYGVVVARD